jgi:hypothetical protein
MYRLELPCELLPTGYRGLHRPGRVLDVTWNVRRLWWVRRQLREAERNGYMLAHTGRHGCLQLQLQSRLL